MDNSTKGLYLTECNVLLLGIFLDDVRKSIAKREDFDAHYLSCRKHGSVCTLVLTYSVSCACTGFVSKTIMKLEELASHNLLESMEVSHIAEC